jgi:hypothetical protein
MPIFDAAVAAGPVAWTGAGGVAALPHRLTGASGAGLDRGSALGGARAPERLE